METMAKANKKSSLPQNLEHCGPVEDRGDVLIYSKFGGWRVTGHSEYVGFNEIDGRHEFRPHRMHVPPGLSFQSGGLWDIATKTNEENEPIGAFSEYVEDAMMFEIPAFSKLRPQRAMEYVADTGSVECLHRLAEDSENEKVIAFIREQVKALEETGDASRAARKLQRAHNRSAR